MWKYFTSVILLASTSFASSTIINGYVIEPNAKLSGVNLYDADLTNAKLTDANLSKANLSDAQLQLADFSGADLRGANLKDADITFTKFDSAQLGGAIWVNGLICKKNSIGFCRYIYTKKKKPVKKRIILQGKNLSNENHDNKSFEDGDLRGSNFWKTSLKNVNFKNTKLQGATFKSAELEKADFSGADLRGTDFRWANLTGVNFENADLYRTRFEGATWIDGSICGKKSIGKCSIANSKKNEVVVRK